MARYAWYTRVSDTLHRLTVLTLVGGALFMSGNLAFTLWMNGRRYNKQLADAEAKQAERLAAGAAAGEEEEAK